MAAARYYGTGRRKSSVARVRLYPGSGKITINGRDVEDYFGLETLKLIINQPFGITGTEGKFDVHLHFGIYIKTDNYEELSVNPYYILKYLENCILYANY